MILQSHNSWSYLKPSKWWLKPFHFIAKCQNINIYEQYNKYGVRSFDLRVRFDEKKGIIVAHGFMEFSINYMELMEHLKFLNDKGCYLRILHEARNKKQYTNFSVNAFKEFCSDLEKKFPNIIFFCGKNLYKWTNDYEFVYSPSEDEKYSSVTAPKIIDDWWPWIYAKLNNKKILKKGTEKDILSIDFVNIR